MDMQLLAGFKLSAGTDGKLLELNGLIARAAKSWNPEYPGRNELPHKYARLCWATMILAASRQRDPQQVLPEVCRIKGIDESEVIDALEMFASRIKENDRASQKDREIKQALINRTRSFLERLK